MGKTIRKPSPKKESKTRKTSSGQASATKKPVAKASPAERPARKATPAEDDSVKRSAVTAAQYALDKKAENVRLLDLRGITSMTDFFVIATGTSQPQVKAIAENVIKEMRDTEGMAPWRSEGWESLEWVLIDFVDFVVHIFQPTARQYYNVERLWGDAPAIDVEDNVAKPKRTRRKATLEHETPKPKSNGVRVISEFKEIKK